MKTSHNLGYYFSEGFRSIFTHGLMSFAAVFMIVACLIIMGSFSLVALNLERELGQLEEDNQFLAFVDESLTREEGQALQSAIEAIPNVSQVVFTTKEQAQQNYAEKYAGDKNAALYAELPPEVFRDRFAIHMEDLSRMGETIDAVEAVDGIDGHQAAPEVAEGFVLIRNVATAVALILIVLLFIISLSIIYNTIRLGTFTRREEIAIMKMCGATDGFVRWPFIVEGLILGVMGALLAFFLQWAVYAAVSGALVKNGAADLFGLMDFSLLWRRVLLVFALSGSVIGALGSSFAIRKFLQV